MKNPECDFDTEKQKCGPISLSGTEALTAIAEMEELADAGVKHKLFDEVFTGNRLLSTSAEASKSLRVLKELHEDAFQGEQMTLSTAVELWRKSLNQMKILLTTRKEFKEKDILDYKYWAEKSYHVTIALFDVSGLTP